MIALLIIEITLLGLVDLLIHSRRAFYDLNLSTQALQLLRGEMERVKKKGYFSIESQPTKELTTGIYYSLNVENLEANQHRTIPTKMLTGQVLWQDLSGRERSYQLVIYRCWFAD